jgi:hypothetical protein
VCGKVRADCRAAIALLRGLLQHLPDEKLGENLFF